RLPRAQSESVGQEAAFGRRAVVVVLPAHVPFMEIVRHAEARADVLQIVLDDRAAPLLDEHVERVPGLPVNQVRPCAEYPYRAKLAAQFVWNEVVRIVGTGPCVPERSEHLAGQQPAG